MKKFLLVAHIFQARFLSSHDKDGTNDPFVVVEMGEFSMKTSARKDTNFPSWFETVKMNVMIPSDLSLCPSVYFKVFDEDKQLIGVSRNFIGQASVPATGLGTCRLPPLVQQTKTCLLNSFRSQEKLP
jgi:hypothetical protein